MTPREWAAWLRNAAEACRLRRSVFVRMSEGEARELAALLEPKAPAGVARPGWRRVLEGLDVEGVDGRRRPVVVLDGELEPGKSYAEVTKLIGPRVFVEIEPPFDLQAELERLNLP